MQLTLIRHGDAFAGLHGIIAGPKGCRGLTEIGRHQAAALRDDIEARGHVTADVLLASVLPRAIETAEIIAPALGVDVADHDCELCEVHTGEADGLDWAIYTERYGPVDMTLEPDRLFAPQGESWNSFHDRVRRLLDRLAATYPHERVVAVCHAGVIMASLRVLLPFAHSATGAQLRPSNTGLTRWEHDPSSGAWTLHSFNETTHLDGIDAIPATDPPESIHDH
ncbi:MAG: histidine phosphatase family protein [Acidimicrobiales bacterium]|nr:histidine phosphatase family protein [Acidimicrobiales bacterium]